MIFPLSSRILLFSILLLFVLTTYKSISVESVFARNYGHPAQAFYAALSAVNWSVFRFGESWLKGEPGLVPGAWQKIPGTEADFKVEEVTPCAGRDPSRGLFRDDSRDFRVTVTGRSGFLTRSLAATINVLDIPSQFAVFQTADSVLGNRRLLDKLQAGLTSADQTFLKENGYLTAPALAGLFEKASLAAPDAAFSYMAFNLNSISGAIYCDVPIILNQGYLFSPLATSRYLYIQPGNPVEMLFQGQRQILKSSHEVRFLQKNPDEPFDPAGGAVTDGLADEGFRRINPPTVDLSVCREAAKKSGAYINEEGEIWVGGEKKDIIIPINDLDLYQVKVRDPEKAHRLHEKFAILFSEKQFEGYSNLSGVKTPGTRIFFSELSVLLRGKLDESFLLFTPGHILFSGTTTLDESKPVPIFYAGGGIHFFLDDMNEFVLKNPGLADEARRWEIHGVLVNPTMRFFSRDSTLSARYNQSVTDTIAFSGSLVGGGIDDPEAFRFRVKHRRTNGDWVLKFLPSFNVVHAMNLAEK